MKPESRGWDSDREASPHVIFADAHYCPARGWTYFLTVEGRCPGCGAEVRHPTTASGGDTDLDVDQGGAVG